MATSDSTPRRIAVLGDIFIDVTAGGLPRSPSFGDDVGVDSVAVCTGGSALNTAIQLQSLGGSRIAVEFHGALGDDGWAEMIRARAAKAGVTLRATVVEGSATGVCIVLSGCGDRGFVSAYAANRAWKVSDIDIAALFAVEHIHVGGFFSISKEVRVALPALLRTAREDHGCTVSFDTNFDGTGQWADVAAMLPNVDAFLPNDTELRLIAAALGDAPPDGDLEASIDVLLQHTSFVVVTCGADGVVARQSAKTGGAAWKVGAKVAAAVVDATGCGDAFNAGLLNCWLTGGVSGDGVPMTEAAGLDFSDAAVEAALIEGCAVGTVVISRMGACIDAVTAEDVRAVLRT